MAIKGKSKSRGARSVARGPKPAYVPVKVPFFRRRGLWIVVGVLLGAAAIVGLVVGFVQERNTNREADELERMVTAVGEYRGQVEPILATIGQSVPPSGFEAFPTLASTLDRLETGDLDEAAIEEIVSSMESSASLADDAEGLFGEIEPTAIVRDRGLPPEFVLYLINANERLAQAAHLYGEVARIALLAAEAEGEDRETLVARARGVHGVAEGLFATGYSDYVEAQAKAQVFDPLAGGAAPFPTGPTG